MYIKRFVLLTIIYVPTFIWAQASYMHEAQEDSGNPITGLLGLLLLGGIVYVISNYKNLFSGTSAPIKGNDVIEQPTKDFVSENKYSDNKIKEKVTNPNSEFYKYCIDIWEVC